MRSLTFLLPATLLPGACAGDQNLPRQSPPQPARAAVSRDLSRPHDSTVFARNRIYQITRLQTADQPRGRSACGG